MWQVYPPCGDNGERCVLEAAVRFLLQSFSRRGIHMGWFFHFDSTATTHPEVPTEISKCKCRERNKKGVVYGIYTVQRLWYVYNREAICILRDVVKWTQEHCEEAYTNNELQSSPVPTSANWAGRTPQGMLKFKKSSTEALHIHNSSTVPIWTLF